MIRVRLTKKLASILDGVDVSMLNVGAILELPDSSAALLIAEKWAEPIAELVTEPVDEHVAQPVEVDEHAAEPVEVDEHAAEPDEEHVMTYLLLETSHGQPDSLN
jgi:hypothetical protein